MKVLLVNNFHYLRGGSETVYFNTGKLLKAAGHDVIYFSQKNKCNYPDDNDSLFAESPNGPLNKIEGLINYFNNRNAATQLQQLISRERPDIAHIHLLWGGLTGSIVKVLRNSNIPVVHTAHDYRMICPAYTFIDGKGHVCERCRNGNFYECFIHRCAKGSYLQSLVMASEMYYRNRKWPPYYIFDGVIYVSNFSRHIHEEIDARFRRINSISLYNCTSIGDQYTVSKCHDKYFLYYGRLSREKGLYTLISAFVQRPDLKLVIIGTGPLEDELKAQCSGVNNIEFLGYLTGNDLYEKVKNAFFVCVPSTWYENNPMTIVEAYSLGVPVIGSDLGGIPEIVKSMETGFLFEAGDVMSLGKVIDISMSIQDETYQSMKLAAKSFASAYFEHNRYIEKLLAFYEDVINSSKSKLNKCY